MGTPYSRVYDAFTSKILDDEWETWDDEEMVAEDMRMLLEDAIVHFKFPRVSLARSDEGFENNLNGVEVQIIATYMKIEWLDRCILTWQHLKPLYSEQDFSQANLIDKFTKLLSQEWARARQLEATYYRSVDGKPWAYRNMAGGNADV